VSHDVILIYAASDFSNNKIMSDLRLIRNAQNTNTNLKLVDVILNGYDKTDYAHINNLLQIQNVFATKNMVTTLPVVEELYPINFKSLDFAKKTP
jgi:hypothetical protein